jgi:hypothetical protein
VNSQGFVVAGIGCVLALAACAPAPALGQAPVTPIVRQISPQEAAVIVIDATNTAAAVATRDALATATEISARSTSTTSAHQTQDSVAVEQTHAAIQLTSQAGMAESTQAAAVRTQMAGQTATWAAPTAAAVAIAAQATATAQGRRDAQAVADQRRNWELVAVRDWLLLASGVLFLVGLGGAIVFGVSDILSARAERLRADAAMAYAQAAHLRIMQHGGFLLQLLERGGWEIMQPSQIAAPMLDVSAPAASAVREVPYRKGQVISSVLVGEPETPERERVLHLLGQAISIAGPSASFIPSAERLGMHPQDWQLAIDKLKAGPDRPAYIHTRPGRPKAGQAGGTRLCQPNYLTLALLRDGVKRGDVLPRPQAEREGVDAGNVQNPSFEAS